MDFLKFLISKTFIKNVIAAIILLVIIVLGLKLYLNTYTHHNEYHLVPDLSKKSYEEAKKILEDRKMNIVIIDTVDYNPDFPKYAIVEQNPHKNDKVKVGRKIYVKINNNAYAKVRLPNIIGKTKRQALTLLKASGLQVGKTTYKPYFAEVVLYAIHQKDTLKNGDKLPKTSVVKLVVGDGKKPVDSDENNSENDGTTTDPVENNTADNLQKTLNDVLGN